MPNSPEQRQRRIEESAFLKAGQAPAEYVSHYLDLTDAQAKKETADAMALGPWISRKEKRRVSIRAHHILEGMRIWGVRDGSFPLSGLSKPKPTNRNLVGTNFRVRK